MTNLKNIILTGRDGRPSMKNTYSKMKSGNLLVRRRLPKVTYYRLYKNNNSTQLEKVKTPDLSGVSVMIRWGSQEEINIPKGCVVYNNSKALRNVSNKSESRKIMAAAGVNVPLNVTNQTPKGDIVYPVIARPHHHSKGKNFVTLKTYQEFINHYNPNSWYYSNFVDKVKEFRVHAFMGKCLNLLEKPNPGPGHIAWNRAQNHEAFTNVKWDDYNMNVVLEAFKACKALGADFSGVDVLLDANGKAWVLECNSSPTLNSSEYSCLRYAKAFDWLFRSNVRREHWDFTQFKKAKSLAWKDFQLDDVAGTE